MMGWDGMTGWGRRATVPDLDVAATLRHGGEAGRLWHREWPKGWPCVASEVWRVFGDSLGLDHIVIDYTNGQINCFDNAVFCGLVVLEWWDGHW